MKINIGDTFSKKRTVTHELICAFAEISGDYNPIHLDEEFAKNTRFGKRIAHGMISGAFISAVLGQEMSERSIVYLSQTMTFTAPVYVDDTITTTATVTAIRVDKGIITLDITCRNQTDDITLTGEAKIMLLG